MTRFLSRKRPLFKGTSLNMFLRQVTRNFLFKTRLQRRRRILGQDLVNRRRHRAISTSTRTQAQQRTMFRYTRRIRISRRHFIITLFTRLRLLLRTLRLISQIIRLKMNITGLLTIGRRLRALHRFKIQTIALTRKQRFSQMIHSRNQLSGLLLTMLTRSNISRLTLTRHHINLSIRALTNFTRLLLTLTNSIMTNLFTSNINRQRTTRQHFRQGLLTIRHRLHHTICNRNSFFRRLLNRFRRPRMILMNRMGLRSNRFKIIHTIRTFITRILTRLMSTIRSTSSRFLRMRLTNSTRMLISIRHVIIHSRQAHHNTTQGELRGQNFSLSMTFQIRRLTRNQSSFNTLSGSLTCLQVSHRVSMALTMTSFKVNRNIRHLTILLLSRKRQTSQLQRRHRLTTIRQRLTHVNVRHRTFSTSRITSIRRFLRRHIVRHKVTFKTSIITTSMSLGTTHVILRFRRQDTTRSTTHRSTTYSTSIPMITLNLIRIFNSLPHHNHRFMANNKMKISTRLTRNYRQLSPRLFLFARFSTRVMYF